MQIPTGVKKNEYLQKLPIPNEKLPISDQLTQISRPNLA